ncbi:MAG TPA: hypothetical protein PK668_09360 [Myxococcota bacterium]|nr:hypothetical protein [Myxococcota bacterium]HRY92811.1 hypothetical protein [Myxococcota bacterium]HSA19813.1 hypothetical protein [Myxococcota bacterium]
MIPGMPPRHDPDARPRLADQIGLGLRMSLWTALVVTLVLGSVSYLQQRWEIARELEDREAFLKGLLEPLVTNLEEARDRAQVRALLDDFRQASLQEGFTDLQLELRDGAGLVVGPGLPWYEAERPRVRMHTQLPVYSPLLVGGNGTLAAWQDDARFAAAVARRWRFFGVNLALVVASILASLLVAEHFLVTRPLRGLLRAARLAGRGHYGGLERIAEGGRAPEWRALASQLQDLGRELEDTVRRLMEAERRGGTEVASPSPVEAPRPGPGPEHGLRRELVRRFLQERLKALEASEPGSLEAHRLAGEIWTRDVAEAERLGEMELRARLDDAALRVLEPELFRRVRAFLSARSEGREAWLAAQEKRLRSALAGVAGAEVLGRVKHAAGVYRKMQSTGLPLEGIPDVFGFRVLVPSTGDCYRALAAVHAAFQPEPLRFKDYIAEPKANGYQSLHTGVRAADGQPIEVQVRTFEMHRRAELGRAAHWQYKLAQTEATPPPGGPWSRAWTRLARLAGRLVGRGAAEPQADAESNPPESLN